VENEHSLLLDENCINKISVKAAIGERIGYPNPKLLIPIRFQIAQTQNNWVLSNRCGQTNGQGGARDNDSVRLMSTSLMPRRLGYELA
jgi:hypothetical protein